MLTTVQTRCSHPNLIAWGQDPMLSSVIPFIPMNQMLPGQQKRGLASDTLRRRAVFLLFQSQMSKERNAIRNG